ncbi:MAG TPA: VOC family protein [Mycobacterium sp.]
MDGAARLAVNDGAQATEERLPVDHAQDLRRRSRGSGGIPAGGVRGEGRLRSRSTRRASDRGLDPDGFARLRAGAVPGVSLRHVYVDDADAVFRRALAAGATALEEPFDTPYGDRRAMVGDRFGNVFQIAHTTD